MLTGKNAFITGCNRGIGKAILGKLMSNNANIYCAVKKKIANFRNVWKGIIKPQVHGLKS